MTPQPLRQSHIDWLLSAGVTMDAICRPEAMLYLDDGEAMYFPDDDVMWWYKTGEMEGHFCLGADNITDAGVYALDGALEIFETPMAWLKANRRGIVVIDWSRAFDELRHAPRVSVPKSLLAKYRAAMKPPRMPDVRIAA